MEPRFCGSEEDLSCPSEMKLTFSSKIEVGSMNKNSVTSEEVSVIKVLDRAEYDALGSNKSPNTIYMIRG